MKLNIMISLEGKITKGDILAALSFAFARCQPVFSVGDKGEIKDNYGIRIGSWIVLPDKREEGGITVLPKRGGNDE